MKEKLSTGKTLLIILVYFVVYFAGALISSLLMDLLFHFVSFEEKSLYYIFRNISDFIIVFALIWLFTYKVFHFKFDDFGINLKFKWWSFLIAVLLPAFIVIVYLFIGDLYVNETSPARIALLIFSSLILGLRSGFLEEILFRGIIMRTLENRWNKAVAIIVPSFVFSLLHIPGMQSFSFIGIMILILAGTMVGIMFSMAAYKGKSIANSAIIHTLWNFTLIVDFFNIGPTKAENPVFSIVLPTDNIFITGSDFGIEASMIAIAAYILVSLILWVGIKKQKKNIK